MKSAAVVFGLGSVVLLALAVQPSIGGEASENYKGLWECRNVPIQQAAYFSGIFEANADRGEVQKAYTQMLAAKYGYQGQTNCGVATSTSPEMLAKLKEDQARYVKQLQQSQIKVVVTGWVFAGAAAPAPSPAPATALVATAATSPAGAYSKFWVCRGNTNAPSRDMYITKPFAMGTDLSTQRKMQPALASYMQAHYKPTVMTCDYYGTQAEADARVEWLINNAHTYHFDYVPVSFNYP